jgi:hypothetical protein
MQPPKLLWIKRHLPGLKKWGFQPKLIHQHGLATGWDKSFLELADLVTKALQLFDFLGTIQLLTHHRYYYLIVMI